MIVAKAPKQLSKSDINHNKNSHKKNIRTILGNYNIDNNNNASKNNIKNSNNNNNNNNIMIIKTKTIITTIITIIMIMIIVLMIVNLTPHPQFFLTTST